MTDIVKTIDPWALNLLVILLAVYFIWSVKGLIKDFKDSINELKKLITDLYKHRNDHEARITALETKCAWEHGEVPYEHQRQTGGRRPYDPPLPVLP